MKQKWDAQHVECVPVRIPVEEYNQILEEFAELIYLGLCQLQKDEPLVSVSPDESQVLERTGTDG